MASEPNTIKTIYSAEISATEKKAARIGKRLDRYTTEGIRLEQKLSKTEEETAAHKQAIIENDSLTIVLKEQLIINRVKKDSVGSELG